jgi:hypothetical protein
MRKLLISCVTSLQIKHSTQAGIPSFFELSTGESEVEECWNCSRDLNLHFFDGLSLVEEASISSEDETTLTLEDVDDELENFRRRLVIRLVDGVEYVSSVEGGKESSFVSSA